MKTGELLQREVMTVAPTDAVIAAARLMREKHIGYLVVTEPSGAGDLQPVGVLTDRDIVVTVVAPGIDPGTLRVGDIMTARPVVVSQEADVSAALDQMRRLGVRRMPVVGHRGEIVGVLSLDDVLDAVTSDMQRVAGSIRNERRIESSLRR
jgi:CBS domain-containing protein